MRATRSDTRRAISTFNDDREPDPASHGARQRVRIKALPGALRVIAPEVGAGAEKPPPQTAGADLPAPIAPAVTLKEPETKGSKPLPESTTKN